MNRPFVILTAVVVCSVQFVWSQPTPLGTGFTYQGEIQENGSPVNGTVHLRFSLWDAVGSGQPPTGGNQIGSSQLVPSVSASEGVFSVILNASGEFGENAFNGEARWLQIEVCADTGCASLSILSPRQPVTGAPYALSTSWNGLSGVPEGFADGFDDIGAEPWETSGTDIFRATGNVGVGTANPVAKLDVRGGAMMVENIGDQADLLWLASERSWVFRQEGTGATTELKLQSIGGGGNKNFIIQTDGAVGIGTTTPRAKLDVFSSSDGVPLRVNGTSTMRNLVEGHRPIGFPVFHITGQGSYVTGSDFAEAMPAHGDKSTYEPGDVLVLNVESPGGVEKSSRPNDPKVAGVYSTRPGVLGADKDGETRVDGCDVPVAVVGIVPTKVSTENGPVQVGDLLTTSSTPGHAMKAALVLISDVEIHRPGTILGKALEPLEEGTGLVKVLVTLQ
jgi:hypothetical protein